MRGAKGGDGSATSLPLLLLLLLLHFCQIRVLYFYTPDPPRHLRDSP
jgi:hypothetical protein